MNICIADLQLKEGFRAYNKKNWKIFRNSSNAWDVFFPSLKKISVKNFLEILKSRQLVWLTTQPFLDIHARIYEDAHDVNNSSAKVKELVYNYKISAFYAYKSLPLYIKTWQLQIYNRKIKKWEINKSNKFQYSLSTNIWANVIFCHLFYSKIYFKNNLNFSPFCSHSFSIPFSFISVIPIYSYIFISHCAYLITIIIYLFFLLFLSWIEYKNTQIYHL